MSGLVNYSTGLWVWLRGKPRFCSDFFSGKNILWINTFREGVELMGG